MSSTYGEHLKLSIFGQSHGEAIGMTLDGIPAGLSVDMAKLQSFLSRRAPGNNAHSTTRKEPDHPEFLAGLVGGMTCGAPIAAIIRNTNTRSGDYANLSVQPRPGHADFTAHIKYGGHEDSAGGGHFSGRLTAPLCIAGGMCLQWLEAMGIRIRAHLSMCAGKTDQPKNWDPVSSELFDLQQDFPAIDAAAAAKMQAAIAEAKKAGDSVGGVIECVITGLPAGLGEPMFGGMESRIAQIVYGIPAVKGLEFGSGFAGSQLRGSENNDPFYVENGTVRTSTNHAGGILGGITTGMPLIFRAAVKPTPSIAQPQKTVDLSTMTDTEVTVHGRHDPCIAPRAVPVMEAAAALAVYDAILSQTVRR